MEHPVKSASRESVFHQPPSWFEPLDWKEVFSNLEPGTRNLEPFPIHIDLGAGDGGFICVRARNHPETRFLAVERLLGRARKISRRVVRESLANVRVLRIEATYAVEFLFPKKSVNSITILFPDPWPKRRHHPNRLVQTHFLELCAQCLTTDGWIGIKTDDSSYFARIQKALSSCKTLKLWQEADPKMLLPEITDFEKDFQKDGKQIHFVAARPIIHENGLTSNKP